MLLIRSPSWRLILILLGMLTHVRIPVRKVRTVGESVTLAVAPKATLDRLLHFFFLLLDLPVRWRESIASLEQACEMLDPDRQALESAQHSHTHDRLWLSKTSRRRRELDRHATGTRPVLFDLAFTYRAPRSRFSFKS